jgi:hypothetical protein
LRQEEIVFNSMVRVSQGKACGVGVSRERWWAKLIAQEAISGNGPSMNQIAVVSF